MLNDQSNCIFIEKAAEKGGKKNDEQSSVAMILNHVMATTTTVLSRISDRIECPRKSHFCLIQLEQKIFSLKCLTILNFTSPRINLNHG